MLASFHAARGRRHAEILTPSIEFTCRQARVDLREVGVIAVDLGPGLFTGLRGNYSWMAKVQVVLIGTLGTVFVNLFRVTAVCLLAATAGYLPAILFHDYGGTLLIVGWLFVFWALAYRWILGSESEPMADAAA